MVEVGFEKGFGCWIVKVSLLVIPTLVIVSYC